MSIDLVPSELKPELMPKTLVNDVYYAGNREFVTQQVAIKKEISEHIKSLEPWEAEAAKLFSKGKAVAKIAKDVSKRLGTVKELFENSHVQHLVHLYQSLELYMDGPNEAMRKQMLWEIAVDNQKIDPKESIKAIAEMNKMIVNKNAQSLGNSGTVNIVINNELFKRGNLDG